MVSDGRPYIQEYPWMVLFPGLAIFLTVMGLTLMSDGLNDIFSPRLRK
jgi:peptide/nickel transport system permease protein